MESRFAEGYVKRLPGLAGDLVRLKVDLIVAVGNHAIAAARQATTSIPIVMMVAADPVGSQFVKSLARPGGNVTGTTIYSPQVAGKLVEVLKGALPDARDVSVILEPDLPGMPAYIREGNVAAKTLGLRVRYLEVRDTSGLDAALAQVHRQRPDALYVVPSGTVGAQYRRIIRFAMKEKLPTFWPAGVGFAHAGGLVTYGPNRDDMMQRTAAIVDKLLKGAHAADVPVEQRSRFDLAINLRTARALGLTIPPSILVRATHIIE
jgi:putative ABC transport system substrate-binding protein